MNTRVDQVGTLEVALRHATQLLASNPPAAVEQAREILKIIPAHNEGTLLLGRALRACNDLAGAIETFRSLAARNPSWSPAWLELGLALGASGQGDAAVEALRKAISLQRELPSAWRALGDHLSGMGDMDGADIAYAQQVRYSTQDPRLMKAAAALAENRLSDAELLLREQLRAHPTDVAAIRMMAELAARIGRLHDAENLLARCLELAPSFTAARHNYALVLHREYKSPEALEQVNRLLAMEPKNVGFCNLKAAILGRLGEYAESIRLYEQVLNQYPAQAKIWMSYGHALKTAGRQGESIAAYRRSIDLMPSLGEAWWSLANLKTFKFSSHDIEAMQTQCERKDLADEDRYHFDFALGKALEDSGRYEQSFRHYSAANALRSKSITYDADENSRQMERSRQLFTAKFFAEHADVGCQSSDPIFIVGLPRSGSTLLEQILSSHSQVEGTMELPDIANIVRDLAHNGHTNASPTKFADILNALGADDFRELGERYIRQTRIQRKTDAPFFIDKMPNNFAYVGFIHLILPNAKIIDARRHPLGCCFSGFKQHFARGQHFTYSLDSIGRYYKDYVELMAHFDSVLPGRVHRVIYESLVEDFDHEVQRLLDYCGLAFEPSCLSFYESSRAVRTASSEQVRQPIYRGGVDQWRHYDSWLQPLKSALGEVLTCYPEVPSSINQTQQ